MTPALRADDVLILASHDCDVVHERLDQEPNVELAVGRWDTRLDPDGNYTHGKNPRSFQFAVDVPRPGVLAISAAERHFAPRSVLAAFLPAGGLGPSDKATFARWLASRYDRAAFPDAFNERTAAVRKELPTLLRSRGIPLTSVLVALNSDDELSDAEEYIVELVGLVRASVDDASRREAEAVIDRIAGRLGECPGINVVDARVASEAEVSIDQMRYLRAWDLAHISARFAEHEQPAPRGP